MRAVSDIPIPRRMRALSRDRRGYPIPAGVLIDATGAPQFTINDEGTRQKHLAEDRCAICGKRLMGRRWFVGGARSAFHENGAYIDPPLHYECAHYALRVCPFLAAPHYGKRIDAAKVKPGGLSATAILIDQTMIAERPATFVAVLAQRTERSGPYVKPSRPYVRIEFWRQGERVTDTAECQAIAEQAAGGTLPPLLSPRIISAPR
jgi:hypothetical protein